MAKMALTPRSIDALIWARDNGSAWKPFADRPSLPWSASRSRLIDRLVSLGLLENAYPGAITGKGREAINAIAGSEARV